MAFQWQDEAGVKSLEPKSVLLSCFPSAGLAAIVAGHFVVRSLNLSRIGIFEGPDPSPIAVIQSGRVQPPIRVYGRTDFGVVLSEFPPGIAVAGTIAQAIMEGAEKRKVRLIVCFEGVVPHPITEDAPADDESIWVVASRKEPALEKSLAAAKAHPLEDGVIGGVSGALLVLGLTHSIPVIALLVSARATEGYPDHRAGAALIETLDRLLPELTIDTGPLRTQAELIEKALRQAMKAHPTDRGHGRELSAEPTIYQ
ncbi:MAG: PAC2 family protein [Thermoplasmata archaeon]|nr:PAC2 family protein [Thermoplasmata archaeon]